MKVTTLYVKAKTLNLSDSDEEINLSILHPEDILHAGDFAVVKVFGKDDLSFRMYIGRIQNTDAEGYEVKFLKRHGQTMKFQETEEESYVQRTEIVRKLSQPLKNKSARYRNMVSFNTELTDLSNLID